MNNIKEEIGDLININWLYFFIALFIIIIFIVILILAFIGLEIWRSICRKKIKANLDETIKFVQNFKIIANDSFKTRDGYELKLFGQINPNSDYVIITIHDLMRHKKDFLSFYIWVNKNFQDQISVISFDQRRCGYNFVNNNYHLGYTLVDIEDMIFYINDLYPNKKIILFAEGFGSIIASYFLKNKNVYKVFMSNIYLDLPKDYKKKIKKYIGWRRYYIDNKEINLPINGNDYVDNPKFAKELSFESNTCNNLIVRDYIHLKLMVNKFVTNLNNADVETLLIYNNGDPFNNEKDIKTLINKINLNKCKLIHINNNIHYLINSLNKEDIFKLLINNL